MRQQELLEGMPVTDENGELACHSRTCAVSGISKVGDSWHSDTINSSFQFQVVLSRIAMAAPGMFCLPVIMQKMERKPWFKSRPVLHAPFQVLGVGCFLLVMVPVACSIFPQTVTISSESLRSSDPEAFHQLEQKYGGKIPSMLYYNKGL